MKRQLILFSLVLGFLNPGSLRAEISLPHFFSDHMVLQRERPAAVWGKTSPNAEVTVSFKGKSATAKADADGRWRAEIETGEADVVGATLTVTSGSDTVKIEDVLVGEVWFASGQSLS